MKRRIFLLVLACSLLCAVGTAAALDIYSVEPDASADAPEQPLDDAPAPSVTDDDILFTVSPFAPTTGEFKLTPTPNGDGTFTVELSPPPELPVFSTASQLTESVPEGSFRLELTNPEVMTVGSRVHHSPSDSVTVREFTTAGGTVITDRVLYVDAVPCGDNCTYCN